MNSGVTSERVYTALKRRLLAGEFRPGERLDPAILSETLSSSVTPVRDVLNILTGEGLVETRTGEGFHRPHVTAPDLQDLYQWNEQVVHVALRHWPQERTGEVRRTSPESLAECVSRIFLSIGERSPNVEHRRAIATLNDRLFAVRAVEDAALSGSGAEIASLADAIERSAVSEISRLATAYHRRRWRAASDIVRVIYRAD